MPFALVLIGLVLIVTGAKDTYRELGEELVSDFTGPNNFTFWIASLGVVGAVGYIPQARTASRAFMALIIVAMFLANGGFFDRFSEAIKAGPEKITPRGRGYNTPTGTLTPKGIASGAMNVFDRFTNVTKLLGWGF